ncbi:MAG: tRNA-dihydrouridine synthase [Candidatus Kaiserbacteria bacterium]|nr:tRNA-dihydrouridine synthase [Candidatus Kaiserbacteria bacterium]MCB9815805.1 tRNA-dihydrouridine synthase [Candidatus Nomurabacteria bacterium]
MNFWQRLPKPIMALAPMADVTDAAFRRLMAKYSAHERADGSVGGPDVMWTEFVAADGLVRATPEGKEKLMADLIYSEEERPIVAQLFTSDPEHMEYAAKLCRELGFNGIDINMGCPDRSIEKQGCGSAMIKTPEVAKEIIKAAKRGAGDMPVSVKTRVGYGEDILEEWLPAILKESPAAVTIHARTRKEMSKVPAKWERVKRAVEIRNELKSDTLILGNGDVLSLQDAADKVAMSGADGAMIGRALFGNPWFFHPTKRLPVRLTALPTKGVNRDTIHVADTSEEGVEYISIEERLRVMVEHSKLFAELLPFKNFSVMKKHYKAYVNSFPNAAELRAELMEQNSPDEVEAVVERFIESHRAILEG